MSVAALIREWREAGIKLRLDGDNLRISAPKGAVTPEIREQLGAHKAEVIEFLQALAQDDAPATPAISRHDYGDRVPAALNQKRLWFMDELDPENPAYNIPVTVRLGGKLDRDALQTALNSLQERHEVLRTGFTSEDGEPLQVIHAAEGLPIIAEALPDADEATLQQRLTELFQIPFRLSEAPLARIHLLEISPDDHVLLINLHHIISDGWSLDVLFRELTALYNDSSAELPDLPLQFADYSLWQQERLEAGDLDRQLSYWTKKLEGCTELLALPTDRPRPTVQTTTGANQTIRLSRQLTDDLQSVAGETNTTLFMVLLAALNVLLGRYSSQDDINIGTPIAGRRLTEVEGLIGFFINTLVIRSQLEDGQSFRQLLEQVRTSTLDAFENQDVPFEQLVEKLKPVRDTSYSPLFQVQFILQNAPAGNDRFGELELSSVSFDYGVAKFELTVAALETDDGLAVDFEYNTDLFDATTISRLAGHFETLLEAVVRNPDTRIADLNLLSASEREQVISGWNDTAAPYPEQLTLADLFEQRVASAPDSIALIHGSDRLTAGQLNAAANRLAGLLSDRGIGKDSAVGICLPRGPRAITSILAVLKTGAAWVPLDPAYPEDRLRFMADDAGLDLVLTDPTAGVDLTGIPALNPAELVGTDQDPGNPQRNIHPDDIAYVIYTSGSTGRPKGVEGTHRGAVNRCQWMWDRYPFTATDVCVQKTSLNFVDSVWEILGPLLGGAPLVLLSDEQSQDPAQMIAALAEHSVSRLVLVPSLLQAMLDTEHDLGSKLPGLTHWTTSGEALSTELARRFRSACPDALLLNLYGSSEVAADATWCEVSGLPAEMACVPIGRPVANLTTYLLDAHGNPVPPGVAGEIYVGGVGLARGYRGQPELTRERFLDNPFSDEADARFYRTGDIGRYREGGQIEYLGRTDNQVKVRGFRVELGEVDAALESLAGVTQGLTGTDGDGADSRIVGWYTGSADEATVRSALQQKLPEYMVPALLMQIPEFPLTPNGKVDRKALPAPSATVGADVPFVAPETDLQRQLTGLWSELLNTDEISIHASFFDLGGHSLLGAKLLARIRKALDIELPLAVLFDQPTIAGLASAIEGGEQVADREPIPRAEGPVYPLSFPQERLWLVSQMGDDAGAYNLPWALTLRGDVDTGRLEQAIAAVLARHDSLRTTFNTDDNNSPVQVVHDALPVPLPVEDMTGSSEAAVREAVHGIVSQRFNLETGPLLRTVLLRTGEQNWILVVVTHHIVSDGWSNGVLIPEILNNYQALSDGQPVQTEPLPIQYADFATWQRSTLGEGGIDRQADYWREKLTDAPTVLPLATDFPRPARQSFSGASLTQRVSPELVRALRELSRQEGASLFMLLLAAWNLILRLYSGQNDILVGSPVAGRPREELEPLIGFFVNTVVIRSELTPDETFIDLLKATRSTVLEAHSMQDLPFERLVEDLQPERSLAHSPIFQVMFTLQNIPVGDIDSSALDYGTYDIPSLASKFDLVTTVQEAGDELQVTLEYATDLFREDTVARMGEQFISLLGSVCRAPRSTLAELSTITDEAHVREIAAWNDTAAPYPAEATLTDLFEQQVQNSPDAIALRSADGDLTYAELDASANALAAALIERGAGDGAAVGICLERGTEAVMAILAVLKSSSAWVPLDPAYPEDRLHYMADDAGLALIISRADVGITFTGCATLDLGTWSPGSTSQPPDRQSAPDDTAYVIYTSGSTGRPKGVEGTHRGAVNRCQWMWDRYPFEPGEVCAQKTSLNFVDSVWEIFGPLLAGVPLVGLPDSSVKDPETLLETLRQQNVTRLVLVPSLLQALLDTEPDLGSRLPQLRHWTTSGEALSPELWRRFSAACPDALLLNLYGSSEVAADATWFEASSLEPDAQSVPIGWPIANMQTYLLNEDLAPVPAGVPGEIYVGGAGLARGYRGQPELTAASFIDNPVISDGGLLYRTGDIGRQRTDGALEYIGRTDNQVKVRGFRIELGEVEAALENLDGVDQAIAGIAGSDASARVVAWYTGTISEADTRDGLTGVLPDYMIPGVLMPMDSFPLTPNGKVDRKALPEPKAATSESAYAPPSTELERQLLTIWEKLLDTDTIGIHDDFFRIGGQSLLAVRLIREVEEATGHKIAIATVFENTTVARLAHAISSDDKPLGLAFEATLPVFTAGDTDPLFLVHAEPMVPYEMPMPGLPVYDLDFRHHHDLLPVASIADLAALYIEDLKLIQPAGPYRLAGLRTGGLVALEMARQLEASGERVDYLCLIQPAKPPVHGERDTQWASEFVAAVYPDDLKPAGWAAFRSALASALCTVFSALPLQPPPPLQPAWNRKKTHAMLRNDAVAPPAVSRADLCVPGADDATLRELGKAWSGWLNTAVSIIDAGSEKATDPAQLRKALARRWQNVLTAATGQKEQQD